MEHKAQIDQSKENTRKLLNAIHDVDTIVRNLTADVCSLYSKGLTTELSGIETRLNDYLVDYAALGLPPQTRWTAPQVLLIQDLASRITTLRGAYEIKNLTTNCQNEFDTLPMYVVLTNLELNILAEDARTFIKNLYLTAPNGTVMDVSQVDQATRDDMYRAINALIQSRLKDRLTILTNQIKALDSNFTSRGRWWRQFSNSTFTGITLIDDCFKDTNGNCTPRRYEEANYDHREIKYSEDLQAFAVTQITHYNYHRWYRTDNGFTIGALRNSTGAAGGIPDFSYLYDTNFLKYSGWSSVPTVFDRHQYEAYIDYARLVWLSLVPAINGMLMSLDADAQGIRAVNYPTGLQVDRDLAAYVDYRPTDYDGDGLTDIAEGRDYETNRTSSDTDGDLISDYYEVTHGLIPTWYADGQKDLDGDGYTNLQEFLAGSDASSAQSTPQTALAAKLVPIIDLILQ